MYAEHLPVFQYQVIGSENFSHTTIPRSPPPAAPVRYFDVVTNLAPKSENSAEKSPPKAETTGNPDTPAETNPEPGAAAEG